MQKQFYLTEESWEQLKYIAKDRSYSEVIRELIDKKFCEEIGTYEDFRRAVDGMEKK